MLRSVTEFLLADHRRLHDLLARARAGDGVDVEAYQELRQGLLRHIAIEEKVLFPAVRDALGVRPRWWHDLRVDHAALTSLFVPTPDLALLGEIALLLEEHDQKEEAPDGIYARCDQALSPATSHELALRAEAFRAVRLVSNFDGPQVYRTRAAALAAAARMKRPQDEGAA